MALEPGQVVMFHPQYDQAEVHEHKPSFRWMPDVVMDDDDENIVEVQDNGQLVIIDATGQSGVYTMMGTLEEARLYMAEHYEGITYEEVVS